MSLLRLHFKKIYQTLFILYFVDIALNIVSFIYIKISLAFILAFSKIPIKHFATISFILLIYTPYWSFK